MIKTKTLYCVVQTCFGHLRNVCHTCAMLRGAAIKPCRQQKSKIATNMQSSADKSLSAAQENE